MAKKNKNKYNMNEQAAELLLKNVLNACDKPANMTSFDELLEEINPKERSYVPLKIFSCVMLVLTLIIPLFFPHPPISVQQDASSEEFYLDSNYVLNGNVFLHFFGQQVDEKDSYMLTGEGMTFRYTAYEQSSNTIAFPYEESFGRSSITIRSKDGSEIVLIMTNDGGSDNQ
ncbi:MAG: hypothetical protein KBS85_04880 [Lachnospiraceae bacterium]|nr:hypothetical protein [Candidatus Merdinaster equi]